MGFVVEGRDWSDGDEEGEPSFSAFVFESNTEGEKVKTPNIFLYICTSTDAQMYIFKFIFLSSFTDMLHHKLGEGHHGS